MVTPQFHVKFDPSFHTTKKGEEIPPSLWQAKCGFLKKSKKKGAPKGRELESDQPGEDLPLREVTDSQVVDFEEKPIRHLPPEGETPPEGEIPDEEETFHDSLEEAQEGDSATGDDTEAAQTHRSARSRYDEEPTEVQTHRSARSRYGRHRKATQRLILSFMATMSAATAGQVPGEIFSLEAMFPNPIEEHPMREFMANSATSDPDIMYLHEAMKAPDKDKFVDAMNQEINGQVGNKNFSIILRTDMPAGATLLPAVWAMRRKRRISTREVY